MRQLSIFNDDYNWRRRWVNFETCRQLYEAKTGDTSEDGIPRRNLIRRAVNDHHAVAIQNIPGVRMVADMSRYFLEDVLRRSVLREVQRITESSLNQYVKDTLKKADAANARDRAVKHAAIFGVGYLLVDVDQSADTRLSADLRFLMNKPIFDEFDEEGNLVREGWNEQDAALYKILTKRISVKHIRSENVVWQEGITEVNDKMLRVHYTERFSTAAIRKLYNNENILPTTTLPTQVYDEQPDDAEPHNTTAVLTTYELVPYSLTKTAVDFNDDPIVEVRATDWFLVKTVIAGSQLLEKKVYSTTEGPVGEKSSIKLPIIPYYLQESENHPYGYALPLQLETSEEFINRMYFIMYKAAKKAVANQGVIINAQALGKDDIQRINTVLDEGGVVPIRGMPGQEQTLDLRKVVQPLNYVQSQLPAAMIEATRAEEGAFQMQTAAVDEAALARARSGAGKRAQLAAGDRPKTASINLLGRGQQRLYEIVYDQIQNHHTDFVAVPVDVPGTGRTLVVLNEPYERVLPVFDQAGNPVTDSDFEEPGNEAGLVLTPFRTVINSVATSMHAVPETRADLPHDMLSRFQLLAAMQSSMMISPRTARDLTLSDELRAIDDANREIDLEELRQQQQEQAQLQAQLAQAGMLPGQETGGEGAAIPELEQAGAAGQLLQDQQFDVRQQSTTPANAGAQDLLNERRL